MYTTQTKHIGRVLSRRNLNIAHLRRRYLALHLVTGNLAITSHRLSQLHLVTGNFLPNRTKTRQRCPCVLTSFVVCLRLHQIIRLSDVDVFVTLGSFKGFAISLYRLYCLVVCHAEIKSVWLLYICGLPRAKQSV